MKLLSFVPALEFINVFSLLYAVTGILWCFLSKGNQDYVPFSLFVTLFFCRFFFIVVVGDSAVVCMRFVHTLALQTG